MSEKLPTITPHQRRLLRWIDQAHLPYVWVEWHDSHWSAVQIRQTSGVRTLEVRDVARRPLKVTFEDLLSKKLVVIEKHPDPAYRHFPVVTLTALGEEVLRVRNR